MKRSRRIPLADSTAPVERAHSDCARSGSKESRGILLIEEGETKIAEPPRENGDRSMCPVEDQSAPIPGRGERTRSDHFRFV